MANIDVEAAMRVWREEGEMPYMARSSEYLWWSDPSEATDAERAEGIARLRAADEEADRMNRDLMRRAILAALGESA